MKNTSLITEYLVITMGVCFIAISNYFFLFPSKIIIGGLCGLSAVISEIFPTLQIGFIMIITNIILYIIAFITIGNEFGIRTIFGSILLSILFMILEFTFPKNNIIINNTLFNIFIGVLFFGIGMAIVFSKNASTGGTDISAKIICKKTNLKMGTALLLTDFIIVLSGIILFGLSIAIYSIIGIIVYSLLINNTLDILSKNNLLTSTKVNLNNLIRKYNKLKKYLYN